MRNTVVNVLDTLSATIASGASLSGGQSLGGLRLSGILMPDSWDTANLTFQVSLDGTTYKNLYDKNGAEYTVTAAAGRYVQLDLVDFSAIPFIKIRSGTSGTSVNQMADRSLVLALRSI